MHTLRGQGNKVFLKLRQRTDSVQALLAVEEGKVSKLMVKWASGLSDESIVLVEGVVQKSPEEIKGATIKDVELMVTRVRSSAEVLSDLRSTEMELDRYTWCPDWRADFLFQLMTRRGQRPRRRRTLTYNITESFWTPVSITVSSTSGFVGL